MKLRVGSRRSDLAKAQAAQAMQALATLRPELEVEWVWITTSGDRFVDRPLAEIGGKGLFIKEIESALLAGDIDLAIHSGKDLPARLPEELALVATPTRAESRDVWCSLGARPDEARPLKIGTGSLRRGLQLTRRNPALQAVPIRGNVPTRLGRIGQDLDAVVLAGAGQARLGQPWTGHRETLDWMLPSCAQGTLAFEARRDDARTREIVAAVHDDDTWRCFEAERIVQAAVGGDCFLPFAVLAEPLGADRIALTAAMWAQDGSREVRVAGEAAPAELAALATELGARLARDGAAVR
jgi:hydroxymethylbilane synthase